MLGVGRRGPLGPVGFASGGREVRPVEGAVGRTRPAVSDADGRHPAADGRLPGADGRLPGAASPDGAAVASWPAGAAGRSGRPGRPLARLDERDAWAVLASVDGLGPVTFGSLVRRCGSASAVLDRAVVGIHGLRDMPADPDPTASGRPRLDEGVLGRVVRAAQDPSAILGDVGRLDLRIVTLDDEDYPAALRATELAPPVLFVLGSLSALGAAPAVAVVGTRRPSEHGRRVAGRIAGAVARTGATVVSGLAIGIDGVAHEAALAELGVTVGVLGAGHRHLTPVAHRSLAARIVEAGGAIVSEFAPATEPSRWSFPRRNRIISGLASATVVVEAATRSGALITAAWALEQGRECFLVPGSLDDATARGCLRFLRDHAGLARIVAGIPELLEDLGLASAEPGGSIIDPSLDDLGPTARGVADAVAAGRGSVDEIAAVTALPAAAVLGALTVLELRGLVVPAVGRYRPAGRLATRSPSGGGRPTARVGRRAAGRAVMAGRPVRDRRPLGASGGVDPEEGDRRWTADGRA